MIPGPPPRTASTLVPDKAPDTVPQGTLPPGAPDSEPPVARPFTGAPPSGSTDPTPHPETDPSPTLRSLGETQPRPPAAPSSSVPPLEDELALFARARDGIGALREDLLSAWETMKRAAIELDRPPAPPVRVREPARSDVYQIPPEPPVKPPTSEPPESGPVDGKDPSASTPPPPPSKPPPDKS
jgi:hypothetical protein